MGRSKEVFLELQPEQVILPSSTRKNTCVTAYPESRKESLVHVIEASNKIAAWSFFFFSQGTYCGFLWWDHKGASSQKQQEACPQSLMYNRGYATSLLFHNLLNSLAHILKHWFCGSHWILGNLWLTISYWLIHTETQMLVNPVAQGRPESPSHGALKGGNNLISGHSLLVMMPSSGILCCCFSKVIKLGV